MSRKRYTLEPPTPWPDPPPEGTLFFHIPVGLEVDHLPKLVEIEYRLQATSVSTLIVVN